MSHRHRTLISLASLVVALPLLAACSDSDADGGPAGAASPATSRRTMVAYTGVPASAWAGTVCDGIAAWRRSAQAAAAAPLAGGSAAEASAELKMRLTTVATATTTLARALEGAGTPATSVGGSARMQLGPVVPQLDSAASILNSLAEGEVADAADARNRVTQAGSALKAADTGALRAVTAIAQLEPSGVLGRAMDGHPTCKGLIGKG